MVAKRKKMGVVDEPEVGEALKRAAQKVLGLDQPKVEGRPGRTGSTLVGLETLNGHPLFDPVKAGEDQKMGISANTAISSERTKLRPIDRQIIALHISGYRNYEIAAAVGVKPSYISIILHQPIVRSTINALLEEVDNELRALAPLAVNAIRKGLTDESPKTYLKASDQYWRTQGRYKETDGPGGPVSAEDVIARMLEIRSQGPIDVRVTEVRRKDVRHISDNSGLPESECTE